MEANRQDLILILADTIAMWRTLTIGVQNEPFYCYQMYSVTSFQMLNSSQIDLQHMGILPSYQTYFTVSTNSSTFRSTVQY